MFAHHMNQFNISKRIVGQWLRKHIGVRIVLVEAAAKCWSYELDVNGSRIDLFIHTDGRIFSRMWMYGTIVATTCNLADFCKLITTLRTVK